MNIFYGVSVCLCVCMCVMGVCVLYCKSILLNVLQLTYKIENLGIVKTIICFIKQLFVRFL